VSSKNQTISYLTFPCHAVLLLSFNQKNSNRRETKREKLRSQIV
jgi:hypothetical protein